MNAPMKKWVKRGVISLLAFILVAPFGVFFPAFGAYNPASLVGLATVSSLRAGNYIPYPYIYLVGYSTAFDGGGGTLNYNSAGSTDNGCTKFQDTSGHEFDRVSQGGPQNIIQCGAVQNDSTPAQAAVNLAFAVSTNVCVPTGGKFLLTNTVTPVLPNTTFSGCNGQGNIDMNNVSATPEISVDVNNFTVKGLYFTGTSIGSSGIRIGQAGTTISNTTIRDVSFDCSQNPSSTCGGNIVYLYNASNTLVDHIYLNSVGYGVISTPAVHGVVSLKVINSYDANAFGDFVLLNGNSAEDVLIQGNTFTGSHDFPTAETEERFVGLVHAADVRVLNNFVEDVAGDSCVHAEAGSARITISNNTFIDCQVSGGNNGYIYLLTSTADAVINNNYFILDSLSTGLYGVSTSSGSYTNNIIAEGNTFIDNSGVTDGSLGGFDLAGHSGYTVLSNNIFVNGAIFAHLFTTSNLIMTGNTIVGFQGITSTNTGSSGGGGTNIVVSNNRISTISYGIISQANTSSTQPPTSWQVEGNHIDGGLGVSLTNAVNSYASDNWYGSTLTSTSIAISAGADTIECLDFKQGTGLIHTAGC